MKLIRTTLKRVGPPEWWLAFFLGSCFIGWWTYDENHDYCLDVVLNYAPLTSENISLASPPNTLNQLSPSDEKTLYNMSGFEFLTQLSCSEEYLAVVMVVSSPQSWRRRLAIRETWGASFKLVFLLGLRIGWTNGYANEHSKYGDLVIGNFIDNYQNLTYKNFMALKWIVHRCPSARYILKVHDDVIINPVRLQKFLHERLSPLGGRNLLLCRVMDSLETVVHRTGRSKYRVSRTQYPAQYYPTFCKGSVVILSPDVAFKLYAKVQRQSVPYLVHEDVLITGLIAARTNITHSEIGIHLNSHAKLTKPWECSFKDHKYLFICVFRSLPPYILRLMWKSVNSSYAEIPFVSRIPRHLNSSIPILKDSPQLKMRNNQTTKLQVSDWIGDGAEAISIAKLSPNFFASSGLTDELLCDQHTVTFTEGKL